jgi:uncharacterized membrane protein
MSGGGALTALRVQLRSALWPVPTAAVAVAVGLGIALPELDAALDDGGALGLAFGGGPAAARDLLSVIAGSHISVLALVFSLTVVALQLASSQYSPRLLQTFSADRAVQGTLAQLAATFVYALTVLRTVRTEAATEGDSAFVPRLSITLAFLLAVGSVVAVLVFLGHLARSLRVETMLRDVHAEAGPVLDRELPADRSDEPAALPAGEPSVVCASSSGFVTDVDEARLVAAAEEADAVVLLGRRIGEPVVAGTPVAHVWGSGDLADEVRDSLALGFERAPARDVAYSLRKVVDIAVRALSPGTNDPTTAVHALSHVSAMLGDLLSRPLQHRHLRDGDGRLRVVVPQWDAATLVAMSVEEPLQFGTGQPAVLRRIAALLREVAFRAPRGTVDDELRAALDRCAGAARDSTGVTEEETAAWRSHLEDALAGRWAPQLPPPLRTQG